MTTEKKVLKLLCFQSFFLVNSIGRTIMNSTQDKDDLSFFFEFYQYMIYEVIKRFGIKDVKIDTAKRDLKQKDFFNLYNDIIDYIEQNKNEYNKLV